MQRNKNIKCKFIGEVIIHIQDSFVHMSSSSDSATTEIGREWKINVGIQKEGIRISIVYIYCGLCIFLCFSNTKKVSKTM